MTLVGFRWRIMVGIPSVAAELANQITWGLTE